MQDPELQPWQHAHTFGQDQKRPGEARTVIVIVVTATTMVVEIAAGVLFGSMALLADGLHMASHAAALSINVFAYVYARRHAQDARYSFGTGKVNALGGFSGAVLLAVFALLMAAESVQRLIQPVPIAFNQAIFVAVLGLVVNGLSVFILGHEGESHEHEPEAPQPSTRASHHDHNLRAAYFHVLADTLTSLLAIIALLAAKYVGWIWMDPLMGILGAMLVSRWALGLLHATSSVLLDKQASPEVQELIRASLERANGERVVDLHVWSIGPNIYAAVISIVTREPQPPEHYRRRLPAGIGLVHVTIEVHIGPERVSI